MPDWSEWQGVIGALGGVTITSFVGLATAKLTHRWQLDAQATARVGARRAERSELRRHAYVEYLVAAQAMTDRIDEWMLGDGQKLVREIAGKDDRRERLQAALLAEVGDQFTAHDAAQYRLRLLVSPQVDEAIDNFEAWLHEAHNRRLSGDASAYRNAPQEARSLMLAMRADLADDDEG
jgi:hypothetical protein